GLVLIVGAIVATVLANSITRPLRKLVQATETMRVGDYEQPLEVKPGRDELGVLINAFESMRAEVARANGAIVGERDLLGTVVGSVDSGIALTTDDGDTLLTNNRWRELFGKPDLSGAGHLTRPAPAAGSFESASEAWLSRRAVPVQADFEDFTGG